MNVSSSFHQPPAYIFKIILADFFLVLFNFFWFTCPIENAFLIHTEIYSWMDSLKSWFRNLPSTFTFALCPGSLWLYNACFTKHLMSNEFYIFQAGHFSRTAGFFVIIGWMFAFLVTTSHQDTWYCFCIQICKYRWAMYLQ